MYIVDYGENWDKYFCKLDNSEQSIIRKKIEQLKTLQNQRHLKHGLPYFVLEIGQRRGVYEEIATIRKVLFAGNHKQYEKWLLEQ